MIGALIMMILRRGSVDCGVNPKAMVDSYPEGHVVSFNYSPVTKEAA